MRLHYIGVGGFSLEVDMIKSRLTSRSQTTIPRGVREALEVGPGDELAYEIHRGYVILRPARHDEADPALAPFLAFLADDLRRRPDAIAPVTPELVRRIQSLVGNEPFDPDEPIEGDVAL